MHMNLIHMRLGLNVKSLCHSMIQPDREEHVKQRRTKTAESSLIGRYCSGTLMNPGFYFFMKNTETLGAFTPASFVPNFRTFSWSMVWTKAKQVTITKTNK